MQSKPPLFKTPSPQKTPPSTDIVSIPSADASNQSRTKQEERMIKLISKMAAKSPHLSESGSDVGERAEIDFETDIVVYPSPPRSIDFSTPSFDHKSQSPCYHVSEARIVRQLQSLLNFNPTNSEEKIKYNDTLVQLFIQDYPEVFAKKHSFPLDLHDCEHGEEQLNFPLWRLCTLSPSLAAVEACYRACPLAIAETCPVAGTTPLYNAVRYDASPEVLSFLIQKCPDCLLMGINGFPEETPLNLAILQDKSLRILEILTGPTTAIEDSQMEEKKPWFYACYKNNPDVLGFLLERYPLDEDNPTLLKLLFAAMDYSSIKVMDVLIQKYPNAMKLQDSYGRIALHRVLDDIHAENRVVEFLFQRCPDAARSPDEAGRIPLHYAVADRPETLVRLLLAHNPNAVRCRDRNGKLPLHYAAALNWKDGTKVVETLLQMFPNAARVRDNQGMTPLHHAASRGDNGWLIVKQLLKIFPDALKMTDHNQKMPLHHAVSPHYEHGSPEMVKRFVELYPSAARVKDGRGQVPLHLAVSAVDPVEDIVHMLVAHYPIGIKVPDSNGYTPGDFAQMRPNTASIAGLFFKRYPSLKSIKSHSMPLIDLTPPLQDKPKFVLETSSGGFSLPLPGSVAGSYFESEHTDGNMPSSHMVSGYDSSVLICEESGINHEEKIEI